MFMFNNYYIAAALWFDNDTGQMPQVLNIQVNLYPGKMDFLVF